MRKKVLSLVLSAGMLLSMVPNNVMADTTSQTDSSVAAGQTEEGKPWRRRRRQSWLLPPFQKKHGRMGKPAV